MRCLPLAVLAVSIGLGFTLPARADATRLDPDSLIARDLLTRALAAHADHASRLNADTPIVIVDYGRRSDEPRLYVLDLQTGAVTALRAAHGLGSDADHDGYLERFSAVSGSSASPEGAFRIAERYTGKHGTSLRLDGLDEANANSRARAIVIHAADYAEPDFLARHGKLGRSNGCIVFSQDDLALFLQAVPSGAFLFVGR